MDKGTQLGQVLMARQPIFDREQNVVAYELLYRTEQSPDQAYIPICGSTATSQVILNVYTSISESGETKQVPAFINLTQQLLVDGNIPDLPRNKVVIEILEDVEVNDELIEAVRKLRDDGYRIALDDFIYDEKFTPLLELANIVKVDVLGMSVAEIEQQVKRLRPYKVTLLAEKIETHDILEACKMMGFKLFQGYFLSEPKIVKGRKLEGSQMALMQLLQELQNTMTTPARLEELIMMDPVLTYRLLRIVNSANYNLVRSVQSISEAIVLLGLAEIRKWATLIAMATGGDKPDELTRQLLLRGRMSELVAQRLQMGNAAAYFMAGMLSGLDALLDVDKETLMQQVPLDDEIKAAINDGSGLMGQVLNNVLHYERGNWDQLPGDLNIEIYDEAYREGLKWTHDALKSMQQD